jgi:ABC-2 type transport system ATP-binding protein
LVNLGRAAAVTGRLFGGTGLLRTRLLSTRRRVIAAVTLAVLLVAGAFALVVTRPAPVRSSVQLVAGTPEPGGGPVLLDTTIYLPASTPAPAILLAHGFGGSKNDLVAQARSLARSGYVVLAYSARGFGASGGLIHLDSLKYEVADASRLLDWLQARPEVARRGGQPVLGVAGSSYGGALALMLGATDHRISAVAADITWNNLAHALFPNAAGDSVGVFKKLWAGYLFSAGFTGSAGAASGHASAAAGTASGATGSAGGGTGSGGGTGTPPTSDQPASDQPTSDSPTSDPPASDSPVSDQPATGHTGCGRFALALCRLYQNAAAGGALSPELLSLLADSSPSSVLAGMRAPVLLTQGEQDSLFPLSEADANARQLTAAGAPVLVRWRSGGHDAPGASDDVSGWQRQFFDQRLRSGQATAAPFLMSQLNAGISATNGRTVNATLRSSGYPAVSGSAGFDYTQIALSGGEQQVSAPAGGTPAAVSSIPGLGDVLGAAAGLSGSLGTSGLSQLPGQTAVFASAPLSQPAKVVGSSKVSLEVTAGSGGNVTLFAAIHDVAADGTDTLPARLVAPISVHGEPGQRHLIEVGLPWIVDEIPAGHRIVLEVSTTDFGYAMPVDPDSYRIALAGSGLALSSVPTSVVRSGDVQVWVWLAGLVVLGCIAFGGWRLRARRPAPAEPSLAGVPVVVSDLQKVYADGYRAVDGVSFQVERGQVLGLLGPNGAGKTTTLRVLMGLIMPTAGSIRVFGEQVVPGAPVLSRLGAFVEGPGFLPHLTGADNLRLFWAASGRPAEQSGMQTVLEIAGLGSSIERKVKTYSHGMQQRLAIAQAMLGLPEVLILDEPTNGLDPPQIAEMRQVLASYAATGRTVIVSSHLLAEVEQTCTHVVVMHRGRLVAAGSVAEVAGTGASQLEVPDAPRAARVLAAAGIASRTVPARRALEDVFLDLIGERGD